MIFEWLYSLIFRFVPMEDKDMRAKAETYRAQAITWYKGLDENKSEKFFVKWFKVGKKEFLESFGFNTLLLMAWTPVVLWLNNMTRQKDTLDKHKSEISELLDKLRDEDKEEDN